MDAKQRWLGIIVLGAAVAVLALRAPEEDKDVVKLSANTPQKTRLATLTTREESTHIELDKLKPRQFRQKTEKDIFKGKSWYVPPPPPKPVKPLPPPPPPPPTAPPLPYAYMGTYDEPGQKSVIYLTKAGKIYQVYPGQLLDGVYQVGKIENGFLSMTYMPLNIKQTLNTR